jgi:hypothetical protein
MGGRGGYKGAQGSFGVADMFIILIMLDGFRNVCICQILSNYNLKLAAFVYQLFLNKTALHFFWNLSLFSMSLTTTLVRKIISPLAFYNFPHKLLLSIQHCS